MCVTITNTGRRGDVALKPPGFDDFVQRRSRPMLRAAWLLTGGDWALAEYLAVFQAIPEIRLGGLLDSRPDREVTACQRTDTSADSEDDLAACRQ